MWQGWNLAKVNAGGYVTPFRRGAAAGGDAKLEDYCWPDTMKSLPQQFTKRALLREG